MLTEPVWQSHGEHYSFRLLCHNLRLLSRSSLLDCEAQRHEVEGKGHALSRTECAVPRDIAMLSEGVVKMSIELVDAAIDICYRCGNARALLVVIVDI